MKAKTQQGERLRRLAFAFASAAVNRSWKGSKPPEEHARIDSEYVRLREKLFSAIDELTSTDLTPRAVSEGEHS